MSETLTKDQLIQEIKDLFAKYGSGNYVPSEAEKDVIDTGLESVIEQYRKAVIDDYEVNSFHLPKS